jgi:hypothetical protein
MKKFIMAAMLMLLLFAGVGLAGDIHSDVVTYSKTSNVTVKGDVFQAGLTIMDCQNMVFEDCEIAGFLNLNDSYPEIGLRDILFLNCDFHDATTDRLVFLGATTASNIFFDGCTFRRCISGTHIVYMSGGHWHKLDPNGDQWPPITNIRFTDCIFEFNPAGRHNLQFNGRFKGVKIIRCLFRHAQLNGLSLIGVQDAVVRDCVFYGHNKGWGIVIYDYAWPHLYNNFKTQADIDKFKEVHWPCKNILVERNTIVVGPNQFSIDPWHKDSPKDRAGIILNNGIHSGFLIHVPDEPGPPIIRKWDYTPEPDWNWDVRPPGDDYIFVQFDYPYENIVIKDNIILNFNKIMLDFQHEHEATQTSFDGNMVYTPPGGMLPWIRYYGSLESCTKNLYRNPLFPGTGWPKYGFVDLGKDPEYDWTQFKTFFDSYSPTGQMLQKGALPKPKIKEQGK